MESFIKKQYGQKKKRQAIQQYQQRAKRRPSSHGNNPFSLLKVDGEDPCEEGTSDDRDASSVQPSKAGNPFSFTNPVIAEKKNIFLGGESLPSREKYPFRVVHNVAPTSTFTNVSTSSVPPCKSRLSIGKRNPSTWGQNSQQLLNDFSTPLRLETQEIVFARKQGTCPYMCSQKEYLDRLDKRIWSSYETDGEEKFKHALAVKEFQRSSADKDESQLEDLRPSLILQKTTQYLFIDLLSRYDSDLEGMYGFLWDRTRAIRKDITQQRLSDTRSLVVLESIARFHIFSAYLMAGSDQNYDQKHNNENLEKTMTSLRHVYEDRRKRDKEGGSEAEFRMYHILLNLNSGKIMREVACYPLHIMQSEYVCYALQCYNAYNTKNFVRFLKLFQCGPLLGCCILYRYINNVRQRALVALINSHTTQSVIEYPMDKLQVMLGCDSMEETTVFVTSMKVEVTEGGSYAKFRKHSYAINQNVLVERLTTIDKKITTPLGKLFFTEEIIPDSVLGSAILSFTPVSATPISIAPDHVPDRELLNIPHLRPAIAHVTVSLISQVCLSEVQAIIKECLQEQVCQKQAKMSVIVELLDEVVRRGLAEVATEVKEEKKRNIHHYTKELYLELFPQIFLADLVREVVWEEAAGEFIKVAHEELTETAVKAELRTLLHSNTELLSKFEVTVTGSCDIFLEELVEMTVQSQLIELIPTVTAEMTAEKKQELREVLEQGTVQKRYFFKRWQKRYEKINAKRHALDSIPPRIVSQSSTQVLDNLLGRSRPKHRKDPGLFPISRIANIDLTSPTKSLRKKMDVQRRLKMRMDLLEETKALRGIPLKCFDRPLAYPAAYITLLLDTFDSKLSQFLLDSFGLTRITEIGDYFSSKVRVGSVTLKLQVVDITQATVHTIQSACRRCNVVVANTTSKALPQCSSPIILIGPSCPTGWAGKFVQQPQSLSNFRCCNLYKALDLAVSRHLKMDLLLPSFKVVNIRDLLQSVICVKLSDVLLSKQSVLIKCPAYSVNPNEILTFYNFIVRYLSRAVKHPELSTINWPSKADQWSDLLADWNASDKMAALSGELEGLCLPPFRGELDSADDCISYCCSVSTFSSQLLLSRINGIIEQSGVQWCAILNQTIHHVIENAVLLNPHTVLLEWQLYELGTLNGERMVERALVYNELVDVVESCRAEDERQLQLGQAEIEEIWESLQLYEAKLQAQPQSSKVKNKSFMLKETVELENVSKDLNELTSAIAKSELVLQEIVNEGMKPSYLAKSLLRNTSW